MTKDEAQRWLPLFTAFACGRPMQMRQSNGHWEDVLCVNTNLQPWKYRVRPEPKTAPDYGFLINASE
jgi:hypothetical protein